MSDRAEEQGSDVQILTGSPQGTAVNLASSQKVRLERCARIIPEFLEFLQFTHFLGLESRFIARSFANELSL